jgi:hypothetical protein
MGSIRVTKIALTSSKLAAMKQAHRNWLFFLGHVSNELMMLNKWVLWSDPHLPPEDVRQKGAAAQTAFLLRLLLGKQHEAADVLAESYFSNPLRKEIDPLLDRDALEAEKNLEAHFAKRQNTINYWVRNNFSFHYAFHKLSATIPTAKKAEELALYVTEQSGNTLYDMSEVVVSRAMLAGIDVDVATALDRAVKTAVEVNHWFFTFADGFGFAVLDKPLKGFDAVKNSFEVECPAYEDVHIPWFTTPP